MNNIIGGSLPSVRRRKNKGKFLSLTATVAGGIALSLAIADFMVSMSAVWSPTSTAKTCFYYPEESALPDGASIAQSLMSQAFFGNDALYFDLGDENTKTPDIAIVGEKGTPIPEKENPLSFPEIGSDMSIQGNDIYSFDRSAVPDGELALIPYDLSGSPAAGEILYANTTSYSVNSLLPSEDYPIKTNKDGEPLVLIVHTHGTEAYAPENALSIKSGSPLRSSDTSKNIVAVGEVMSDILNASGISTIHVTTMHDIDSYRDSYNLSADTIQKYLSAYPSIKYVFDIHRDAVSMSNGDLVKPICLQNGKKTAQVMILVGTNELGADHPTWENNLKVAVELQKRLTNNYDSFARPISLRGASFNQQFTAGSLLFEIGSAGNTLSEAKMAAEYLAYEIAAMINDNSD